MKNAVVWGLRLLIIHLFFIFIIWLTTYFPGLDLLVSLFYIWVIWQAGGRISSEAGKEKISSLLAGAIAQFPGFFLTWANIKYYWGTGVVSGDFTFAFQLWHTPALPWLSLFSFPVFDGFKSYFIALFFLSPLYVAILVAGSHKPQRPEAPAFSDDLNLSQG